MAFAPWALPLHGIVAVFCVLLVGYATRGARRARWICTSAMVAVSVALTLIVAWASQGQPDPSTSGPYVPDIVYVSSLALLLAVAGLIAVPAALVTGRQRGFVDVTDLSRPAMRQRGTRR